MSAPAQRWQLPGAAGGVKQSPGVRWPGAADDPTAWPRRWFAWFLASSRAVSGGLFRAGEGRRCRGTQSTVSGLLSLQHG